MAADIAYLLCGLRIRTKERAARPFERGRSMLGRVQPVPHRAATVIREIYMLGPFAFHFRGKQKFRIRKAADASILSTFLFFFFFLFQIVKQVCMHTIAYDYTLPKIFFLKSILESNPKQLLQSFRKESNFAKKCYQKFSLRLYFTNLSWNRVQSYFFMFIRIRNPLKESNSPSRKNAIKDSLQLFRKSIFEQDPKQLLFFHIHSNSNSIKNSLHLIRKFTLRSKATFPFLRPFESYQKFSSPISQIPDRIQSNFSFSMSTQIRILKLSSPISQILDPR